MGLIRRWARSTDLMTGMMTRLGKVFIGEGEVPTQARAQLVRQMAARCAACPEPAACAALQRTALRLSAPPPFCPNANALRAMSDA